MINQITDREPATNREEALAQLNAELLEIQAEWPDDDLLDDWLEVEEEYGDHCLVEISFGDDGTTIWTTRLQMSIQDIVEDHGKLAGTALFSKSQQQFVDLNFEQLSESIWASEQMEKLRGHYENPLI